MKQKSETVVVPTLETVPLLCLMQWKRQFSSMALIRQTILPILSLECVHIHALQFVKTKNAVTEMSITLPT